VVSPNGQSPSEPIAQGAPSRIRGRFQVPVLRAAGFVALGLSLAAVLLSGHPQVVAAWAAIAVVLAVPIVRVIWLMLRWTQERDWRFLALGAGLLVAVSGGVALALFA
jgi:hypothetical protein